MRHVWGLDFLRFIAALLVVTFHFRAFGLLHPDYRAEPISRAFPWLEPYTWFGWIGVQIFFVISGFVIAASAVDCSTREFVIKRSIRVLPTLWFSALAAFAIRAYYGEPVLRLIVPLLKSMTLSPVGPYIDGVIWTLVVELIFYIFIVLLMQVPLRLADRGRAFEIGAYALGWSSCVFTSVHMYAVVENSSMSPILARYFMNLTLLRHGMLFSFGMLAYRAWQGRLTLPIVASLLLFATFGLVQIALQSGLQSPFWMPAAVWSVSVGIFLQSLRWNSIILHPLIRKASKALGLLTYPLYLNHFTIGQYLIPITGAFIQDRKLLLLVDLSIVIGFSWLVMEGPEKYLQRSWRRCFHVERNRSPVAASLP